MYLTCHTIHVTLNEVNFRKRKKNFIIYIHIQAWTNKNAKLWNFLLFFLFFLFFFILYLLWVGKSYQDKDCYSGKSIHEKSYTCWKVWIVFPDLTAIFITILIINKKEVMCLKIFYLKLCLWIWNLLKFNV